MDSNIDKYKKDLELLIKQGESLLLGLYNEFSSEFATQIKKLDKKTQEKIKKSTFKDKYNAWYNESLVLIKQLVPERYDDFVAYYKQSKRKTINYETYCISDYLIGLVLTHGWGDVVFKQSCIITKFEQQLAILESLKTRFDSSLYEIKELLQADLFNSELDAAKELQKKGFRRAAGAICGVVIERHLSQVCVRRGIRISKKNPSINDYKSLLQANDVIDVSQMRRIELMADIRNKCDHSKNEEPTDDDISEIISGTNKIIKSVY
jgi:hypothetical protein